MTLSSSVAPTTAGVFVLGIPVWIHTTNLYRVDNGMLNGRRNRSLGATSTQIFPIPPFN